MESFKIENIPVPALKCTAELNPDTGMLAIKTEFLGWAQNEIANLKSEAIRKALISMGWVPPPENKSNHD